MLSFTRILFFTSLISLLYVSHSLSARPLVKIVDASHVEFYFPSPPARLISLSPNITELLYSAGAEENLVGVTDFSNYPKVAQKLPVIGNHQTINLEALLRLKPDLILAWKYGTNPQSLAKLKQLGLPVFMIDASTLEKIPQSIRLLGRITHTTATANLAATQFEQTLTKLKPKPNSTRPSVFIQIWDKPLMTLNQQTIFSQVIQFCGGRNVFAGHATLSPTISMETVLQQKPDIIFMLGNSNPDFWKAWPQVPAVANQQIHTLNPDHTNRATMRTLLAAEKVCKILSTP